MQEILHEDNERYGLARPSVGGAGTSVARVASMTSNKKLVTTGIPATIHRTIDRLKISDEWRTRLRLVAAVAIKMGPRVLRVGASIIRAVVRVAREYPNTATVAVVGAVLTLAASTIPLLGTVLGPIVAGISMITTAISFCVEFMRKQFASLALPQPMRP